MPATAVSKTLEFVWTTLAPLQVPMACEDLILHKLIAGRVIDQADVHALLTANRNAIDVSYLAKWGQALHVFAALADAWKEAFSQEFPPPDLSI